MCPCCSRNENVNDYHPYLHGHANIRATAEGAGLRLVHTDRHFVWSMMVFERVAS